MHFEQLTLLVTQHLAFLVITLYILIHFICWNIGKEPPKTIAALVKDFFKGKIQNTLYSSPNYYHIFRKWLHLQSSSDCNTWSCVISLSFKKITSFLVRSPFSELELFHPAWDDLRHKGVPCLLKGTSEIEHTQIDFFFYQKRFHS